MRNLFDIPDLPEGTQRESSLAVNIPSLLVDLSGIDSLSDLEEESCINLMQIECPEIGGQVFNQASIIERLDEDEAEDKAEDQRIIYIDLDLTSPTKPELKDDQGIDNLGK